MNFTFVVPQLYCKVYYALQNYITSAAFCIIDSTKWKGNIRHTVSGKTCQAWVLDTPHQHSYHNIAFPDGSEVEAENFCRDPMGEGQPWCYTVDPNVRWEFCPVPHCTSTFLSFNITYSSLEYNYMIHIFRTVIF